ERRGGLDLQGPGRLCGRGALADGVRRFRRGGNPDRRPTEGLGARLGTVTSPPGGPGRASTWARGTAQVKSTARGGVYEDPSVARSASGGAARGERGEEGRGPNPRHRQGKTPQ